MLSIVVLSKKNISNIAPQEWRYAFISYYETMFSKMDSLHNIE